MKDELDFNQAIRILCGHILAESCSNSSGHGVYSYVYD
jgi:hypothetical protein